MEIFNEFDKDRSGALSVHEFADMMAAFYRQIGSTQVFTVQDAQLILARADKDENGFLDFDEFLFLTQLGYEKGDYSDFQIASKKQVLVLSLVTTPFGSGNLDASIGRIETLFSVQTLRLFKRVVTFVSAEMKTGQQIEVPVRAPTHSFKPVLEIFNAQFPHRMKKTANPWTLNLTLDATEIGMVLDSSTQNMVSFFILARSSSFVFRQNENGRTTDLNVVDLSVAFSLNPCDPRLSWTTVLNCACIKWKDETTVAFPDSESDGPTQNIHCIIGITNAKCSMDHLAALSRIVCTYSSIFADEENAESKSGDKNHLSSPNVLPNITNQNRTIASKEQLHETEAVFADFKFSKDESSLMPTTQVSLSGPLATGQAHFRLEWLPADLQLCEESGVSWQAPVARARTRVSLAWSSSADMLSMRVTVALDLPNKAQKSLKPPVRWEPILEPWAIDTTLCIDPGSGMELLEIRSDGILEMSLAPDHIHSLTAMCCQFSALLDGSGHSDLQRPTPRAEEKSDFDLIGVLRQDCSFTNDTVHQLELASFQADGVTSDWAQCSMPGTTIQIPMAPVEMGKLRIRSHTSDPTSWGPQPCPWKPRQTVVGTPATRTAARLPASDGTDIWVELEVEESFKSIVVRVPWQVRNLLPYSINLGLWGLLDPDAPMPCSASASVSDDNLASFKSAPAENDLCITAAASTTVTGLKPGEVKPVAFNMVRILAFGISLAVEAGGLVSVLPHVRVDSCQPEVDFEFADSVGRRVAVRACLLSVSADARGGHEPTMLVLYPYAVLVNWTRLPLVWGCYRTSNNNLSPSAIRASESTMTYLVAASEVKILAGQSFDRLSGASAHNGESPESPEGDNNNEDLENVGKEVLKVINTDTPTWNSQQPSNLIFSLPDESGWAPCVAVRSSGELVWHRLIADDDKSEGIGRSLDAMMGGRSFEITLSTTMCRGNGQVRDPEKTLLD